MIFQGTTTSLWQDLESLTIHEVAKTLTDLLEELVRECPQHASDLSISEAYRVLDRLLRRLPGLKIRSPIQTKAERSRALNDALVLHAAFRANVVRKTALVGQASRSEEAHDTYMSSDMLYNQVLGDIRAFDNKATSKTRSAGEDVKEAAEPEKGHQASDDEVFKTSGDSAPITPPIHNAPAIAASESSDSEEAGTADEGQPSSATTPDVVNEVEQAPDDLLKYHELHAGPTKYMDVDKMERVKVLGHGTSGLVWLVKRKLKGGSGYTHFAMKVLRADPSEEAEIMKEVAILEYLDGLTSVVKLHGADYRYGNLYLFFELGYGDLLSRIRYGHEAPIETNCGFIQFKRVHGRLNMEQVQFYAACMVMSVCDLHSRNVVHGDLKPGNMVLDSIGYLKAVDMGISTVLEPGETHCTAAGTYEYMPPEMAELMLSNDVGKSNDGVGRAGDWWTVGIIIHEMIFGNNPFLVIDGNNGIDIDATLHRIIGERFTPLSFFASAFSGFCSHLDCKPLRDLLMGFLDPDANTRLGGEGIKAHSFFKGINWQTLAARTHRAPEWPQQGMAPEDLPEALDVPADHPALQNDLAA